MKQNSEDGWWRFLELCHHLKSTDQLDEFFRFFLTPEEKEDLTKRFLIVKELLDEEKTQRDIAKDLKVSISKITRGSNALKFINKNLKEVLKKH